MKNVIICRKDNDDLIAQIFVDEDGTIKAIKLDGVKVIVDGKLLEEEGKYYGRID